MDQNFMKEKKVLPLVLSMSLPMMLSMLINSLYNIIDSMFVARVGEKALTAISLVYPLQTLVTSISVGFGVGISAAVAFFLGMGEHKKADQSASEGLFLSIDARCTDVGAFDSNSSVFSETFYDRRRNLSDGYYLWNLGTELFPCDLRLYCL